ncbi:MAG: DUF4974 domain-containing protein [Fimbriimonadales bacterium]
MGTTLGTIMGVATLGLGTLGITLTNQDPVAASQDKRVSASMTNASMDDVLEWLRRTGVNFVIESGDAAAKARLNINVTNQPLKDVMDSIANAVGGEWKKNGNVYSLRSAMGFAAPFGHEGFPTPSGEDMRAWGDSIAPKIQEHLKELEGMEGFEGGWHRFEEIAPMLEKELGAMAPELEKRFGELAPHIERMKELEGGMHFKMFDDESVDKLLKSLTAKQKELMKSRGHLTPGDLISDQKALLEKLGSLRGNLTLHKDGMKLKILGPDGEKIHDKIVIAPGAPATPHFEVMPPMPGEPGMAPVPPQPARWDELKKSFTGEQRDLLKKQGHLWDDQLTTAQRRMINLPSGSAYTLTMTDGNESITIKSRKQ